MNLSALNEQFALPGMLHFAVNNGLIYADVTTPAARGTIYLQGAHLTHWQPAGFEPVLFTSLRSQFLAGKAIRGGVPLIFPWFGPRHDGIPGPSHGFARTTEWELAFAALAGDDLHLTFRLAPSDASRALGFDRFKLAYQVTFGRTLALQFTVANESDSPLIFEDALHTYLAVADITRVQISGLEGTAYLDKIGGTTPRPGLPGRLTLTGPTDRVYANTSAVCLVEDPAGARRIRITKHNSSSTVVWNPWAEGAAALADMNPDDWKSMLCVESANVGENAITLAPGQAHTTTAVVAVERSSA